MSASRPLSLDALAAQAAAGAVEDIIVAVPDVQGRLQGSRVDPALFMDEVVHHGFGACIYLLAVDIEMRTHPGYALDPSGTGFGDLVLVPDLGTLRMLPWDPGTALVIADACWPEGPRVNVAPRQVLRAQLDRLADRGLVALAGTELEFLAFRQSYQQASEAGYRDLTTASRHNIDYALAGLGEMEQLGRRIREAMAGAGLRFESARGECHPGQYEIVFRYDEAMTTCDNHAVYKLGARRVAEAAGMALTFMARYDEGEGNSCHVHLSLRSAAGDPVMAGTGERGAMSRLCEHFIAGQLACMREFTLLYAPNVNSYKRLSGTGFGPSAVAWGADNRTCPVRVVGTGPSLRIEHRVPGGDANPYLAVAGMVAAGLHGIECALPLEEPHKGNAFASAAPQLPQTLAEAVALWEQSDIARKTFGDEVVDHYARAGRVELAAFEGTVTDWERHRGFERF